MVCKIERAKVHANLRADLLQLEFLVPLWRERPSDRLRALLPPVVFHDTVRVGHPCDKDKHTRGLMNS